MSEGELLHYLSYSESLLENPDGIEPPELAQYFHANCFYGVHDRITSLV